ncbi:MAG: alpha/beta fold hydrolase [Acidimicrobiia bacterium]
MPTAKTADLELYYETFGSEADPTLLLVNGLGSQCINFADEWCERFAAHGYCVVRFDNRDTGLSSKLDGRDYLLWDMALDAVAVLDSVGADRAHVLGVSMGGMIVQSLAIVHPKRVRSMTSVMSHTGEAAYGRASPAALALLNAPPPTSRAEYIERRVASIAVYGSKPEWVDDVDLRAAAAAAYDRCFCPEGQLRQLHAIQQSGDRGDLLPALRVPTLVMHGSRDTLVDPSGGRRTAELVPGARYVEIEGMGHDYPRVLWDRWIDEWLALVQES